MKKRDLYFRYRGRVEFVSYGHLGWTYNDILGNIGGKNVYAFSAHQSYPAFTRSVLSSATRSFVVFSGHFEDLKPDTAHEKPLAPRVHQSMSRRELRFRKAQTFLNFASLNADCERELGAQL